MSEFLNSQCVRRILSRQAIVISEMPFRRAQRFTQSVFRDS